MNLSSEKTQDLLEIKRKLAVCVAKTNGRTVITRREEGGKTYKYVSIEKNYKPSKELKYFSFKNKSVNLTNLALNYIFGNLYPIQKETGILYGE